MEGYGRGGFVLLCTVYILKLASYDNTVKASNISIISPSGKSSNALSSSMVLNVTVTSSAVEVAIAITTVKELSSVINSVVSPSPTITVGSLDGTLIAVQTSQRANTAVSLAASLYESMVLPSSQIRVEPTAVLTVKPTITSSVNVSAVTSSPTRTVEPLNRTFVMVQASASANTAVSSDEASSKSAVLSFAQATMAVSLTTETSLGPTIASTMKPTTSPSVNGLGVPCNSPCLLVSTTTEIIALDYNDGIIYPVISNLTRAIAIDIHINLGYIFWSDVTERTIKRARNDGTNITVLHSDTGDIGGLAVDWMSLQLYWTDELYNRISVSDLEGNNIRILFSLSLDEPRGIALDPNHGLMFWTDWGQIPKIERASLSGTQHVVIVTSNLQWPVGIDLDRRNRLLFWVDGGEMDRVESVDYHGNNRKLLFQQSGFLFFGVTFFSSNLFISDWVNDGIYKLNASHTNGTFVSSKSFKNIDRLFGIIAYDSSRQLPALGVPCNSPCLLVSTTTEITALDYNSATTHPIIANLTRAVAIDVHFTMHYIFWSDVVERNIKRANIDGTNITVIHNNTVSDALAVEWKSLQLYWIDRIGTISISDFEGNNKRILHSSQGGLSTYRGIVLDPERDLMFWTDSNSGIKRSTLNGTQRTVLVTSLRRAQGIDLDRRNKLVFWVDAETDSVESVDYDGNNRILLYRHGDSAQGNFSFFGLAFFSSYLFVSDPQTRGVVKVNTANRSSAIATFVPLANPPMGLVPYDNLRQLPAITCPAFPAPLNGIRIGCSGSATEYYYNTVCQFACNSGYIGYGSQARRCQYNGTWSGQVFTCQMAVCRSYITLSEAGRAQGSLSQGNPRCDRWDLAPGWYRFQGPAGFRMADKCVPILHCGTDAPGWLSGAHPTVIEGVVTRKVCYHFNDDCCNWNNMIRVRNCGSYFVYELRRTPVCRTRYCGNAGAGNSSCQALPAPSNGIKFGCPENATVYNDTVCQFSCNDGYIGSGSQVRRCQHNGTWSGQDFTCHAVTCPRLSPPSNGELLGCNTTEMLYKTVCRFSCNKGFEAKGSVVRRCTENGTWSGTDLVCDEVDINTTAVVNVTEGESLTVNCSIGTDDPEWIRRDGGDVETKTRNIAGVLLRIENASIADTGVYECRYKKQQHTIWIQVLVQVEVEMELVVENYVFTEELKNKSSAGYEKIEKNFTTEMDKVHRGVTPGYVRTDVLGFKKGSVQVDFKIVIVLVTNDPENETDLPDVKAKTAQRVVKRAETGFVEKLQVKKVIVKTVPLEPANVEIFGIDSDELSVRWNPSENADAFQVQEYLVQHRKFEDKIYTSASQPASDDKTQYTIRIQPLEPQTTYMIRVGAKNAYGPNYNDESAHKTDATPFAWWIIVVVVLIILLVLAILVVLIVYKRKRDREREAQRQGPRIDALELEAPTHEIAVYENRNVKGLTYSYSNDAYKPTEVSWEEIPYEKLKLLDELGSGAFGVVYKAEYFQENGNVLPCAVKSLKPSASKQDVRDLYNELQIMDNVGYHPNLVNLIGACTEDGHLLVVLEIAENGSLIEFLKKTRQTDQSYEINSGLTEQMKTRIATDVARGMAHLAKCRCIHRDLAARNVLLGKDYIAKVSDYGMARDVYEDLMYKKETQGKLPVKWMAIESLQTYIFTIESDVWSYGVLLWEIESGGLKPYAGLSTTELMEELKKGYRLEKPAGCSEEMYQVMRSCWNPNPSARPTFDQLVIQLESEIVT